MSAEVGEKENVREYNKKYRQTKKNNNLTKTEQTKNQKEEETTKKTDLTKEN